MSKLIDELKRKYRTPQEAMVALGLDSALLTDKEHSMKTAVLSRTAARAEGALAAYLLPKLAKDALPKLMKIIRPAVKDITRKNFAARMPALVKIAMDAATPMMTPEAQAAGGAGATPDDVAMALIGMIEGQSSAEPAEMDEQPEMSTEPNGGAPAGGNRAKAMEMLKAKGMTDDECKAVMDMMVPEKAEDEDDIDEEKAKREKEAKDAEMNREPMVTKSAMDEALKQTADAVRSSVLKTQRDINAAYQDAGQWVGKIAMDHDTVGAVYRTALGMLKIDVKDVADDAALPHILHAQPKPGARAASNTNVVAMDSMASKSFAERFPHVARIGNL